MRTGYIAQVLNLNKIFSYFYQLYYILCAKYLFSCHHKCQEKFCDHVLLGMKKGCFFKANIANKHNKLPAKDENSETNVHNLKYLDNSK